MVNVQKMAWLTVGGKDYYERSWKISAENGLPGTIKLKVVLKQRNSGYLIRKRILVLSKV